MGYDNLIRNLILSSWNKSYNLIDLERREAANAITDLLARAEAAEARAEKAEKQLDSFLEDEETEPFDPFRVKKEE